MQAGLLRQVRRTRLPRRREVLPEVAIAPHELGERGTLVEQGMRSHRVAGPRVPNPSASHPLHEYRPVRSAGSGVHTGRRPVGYLSVQRSPGRSSLHPCGHRGLRVEVPQDLMPAWVEDHRLSTPNRSSGFDSRPRLSWGCVMAARRSQIRCSSPYPCWYQALRTT